MSALMIGYARVSTDGQDLTAQREALATLGVTPERIYFDHGLTGTNRERPGLREALAACRQGDTMVVTNSTGWPARSPTPGPSPRNLARHVRLSLGGAVYDPTDPVGRLLFNVLAMVAEFEADLISMRTGKGSRSPRPEDDCAASNPNSPPVRRRTWRPSMVAGSTRRANSPSCSGSAAPPSTEPSNECEPATPPPSPSPFQPPQTPSR
jgi:Resolvase, N terminal domain